MAQLTPEQEACCNLILDVFKTMEGIPSIRPDGNGVKCSVKAERLATYDPDYLTRLVVRAHDSCVRVQVLTGGTGRIALRLDKRERSGPITERHPTMEYAMADIRESIGENVERFEGIGL